MNAYGANDAGESSRKRLGSDPKQSCTVVSPGFSPELDRAGRQVAEYDVAVIIGQMFDVSSHDRDSAVAKRRSRLRGGDDRDNRSRRVVVLLCARGMRGERHERHNGNQYAHRCGTYE